MKCYLEAAHSSAKVSVFDLPGGGRAYVPTEPLPTEPVLDLGPEWVHVGYLDEAP